MGECGSVVFVCGSTSERSYDSEFDDNGAAKAVAEYGATCGEGVDLSDIRLLGTRMKCWTKSWH